MREMDWEEAQSWANFILMKPEALPAEGHLVMCSMRPEAPRGRIEGKDEKGRPGWTISNRACHRLEVVSPKGRIRAKQFLYDWAPPAFDHPSLWRDRPKAFGHTENVGWAGKNYLKQHAGSLHRARTMIEVAVLGGDFADEELADFCGGFQPVSVHAQKAIEKTSLAHLCYQSRHSECPIVVPTGYWFHQRENLKGTATLTFPGELFPMHLAEAFTPAGFALDCIFLYVDIKAPREADLVLTARNDKNHYLRLLTWLSTEGNNESRPPTLDEQPCSTEVLLLPDGRSFTPF
jgi:hypothetical protein